MNGAHAATRMIPGPGGTDSPIVSAAVEQRSWVAWLQLADDRAFGRRSAPRVLADALQTPPPDAYDLLWDRWQNGGALTHYAGTVVTGHHTTTLVSACGMTRAWPGWAVDVDEQDDGRSRTWCVHCLTIADPRRA